jgi:two-component system, sensor histidine kinase and response regulator
LIGDIDSDVSDSLVGDPTVLRQILPNLIGNAVKLTSQGEVVLRVEKQEETEEKVTRHFAVKDTGLGVATLSSPGQIIGRRYIRQKGIN